MPDLTKMKHIDDACLQGCSLSELLCRQCGGFCNFRARALYHGEPVAMCGLKDEVKIALALAEKASCTADCDEEKAA